MAEFNVESLVGDMAAAALPILKKKGAKVRDYALNEFKKLADTGLMLAKAVAKGAVDLEEAQLVLNMQKMAAANVLLTIEGLGIIAVQEALNAAIAVMVKSLKAAFNLKF